MAEVGFPTFRATITDTVVQVRSSPSTIAHGLVYNAGGANAYLQIFNKLAINVILGTTLPDWVTPISPGDADPVAYGPLYLSVALSVACTTTPTGAVAATCLLNIAQS